MYLLYLCIYPHIYYRKVMCIYKHLEGAKASFPTRLLSNQPKTDYAGRLTDCFIVRSLYKYLIYYKTPFYKYE